MTMMTSIRILLIHSIMLFFLSLGHPDSNVWIFGMIDVITSRLCSKEILQGAPRF